MTCNDIIKYFEGWAPKGIAWQKDNVGLQVGSTNRKVKNIMLCLELTDSVLDDAIKKRCNFIFTHHPLLFRPLHKIDTQTSKISKQVEKLIKNNITLYSAHTNLDFTKDGVSFELAKVLKLRNIRFLHNAEANQFKLSVNVPAEYTDKVAGAIFKAGGGIIGEYSGCSFRTEGKGTFTGSSKSKPAVGKKQVRESVSEIKLEVLVDSWNLPGVIKSMKDAHPYEEAAYDVYPLQNRNANYGAGAIGELDMPMNTKDFLKHVSEKLKAKNFRYTGGKNGRISKVAVCGGSGSDLISDAVKSGADAFITADLKYHTFHDYNGEILLIDAGHYETEVHSLNEVKKRFEKFINESKSNTKIFKYGGSTNPIIFYNN